MSVVGELLAVAKDVSDEFAVDGLDLFAGADLERIGGESVDVAEAPLGLFMQEGKRVGVEELPFTARVLKPMRYVLRRIAGLCVPEREARVDPGPERAILRVGEPLLRFR